MAEPRIFSGGIMKPGDLIKLDPVIYPQYKGEVGVATQLIVAGIHTIGSDLTQETWAVLIKGRIHPYVISAEYMVKAGDGELS